MRIGAVEAAVVLIMWVAPLLVVGWLLMLGHRAVRALESVAESLRQQRQTEE